MAQYVYLVRPAQFLHRGEPTYKIGKTTQNPLKYILTTYKDCEQVRILKVINCHVLEKNIISRFDTLFVKRRDLGLEYYTGDVNNMCEVIELLNKYQKIEYESAKQLPKIKEYLRNIQQQPIEIPSVEGLFDTPESKYNEILSEEVTENISVELDSQHDQSNDEPLVDVSFSLISLNDSHTDKKSTDIIKSGKPKSLKAFYKHIYNTKPDWYIEGKFVLLKTTENVYREYFNNDMQSSTLEISKRLSELFILSQRSHNITKKKLRPFDKFHEIM